MFLNAGLLMNGAERKPPAANFFHQGEAESCRCSSSTRDECESKGKSIAEKALATRHGEINKKDNRAQDAELFRDELKSERSVAVSVANGMMLECFLEE